MSSSSRVTQSEKRLQNSRGVVETTSLTISISGNLTSLRVVSSPALHESKKVVFLPWWTRVVIEASSSKNSRKWARFIGSLRVTRSKEMSS